MSTDYAQSLLLTIDEVATFTADEQLADATLSNIVQLLAQRFETDVCSVYLLEPNRNHLVLAATVGLKPDCVGELRMGVNEGLAGLVAERLVPVSVAEARKHPRFKFFHQAGEDEYQSFLGVPLVDRGMLQGVLILQTIDPREFSEQEIHALTDAAARFGPTVSEARTMEQFIAPSQERLWDVARNLWWCWQTEGSQLFRELAPVRWRELNHNPIALLSEIPLAELQERAGQLVLHSRINHVYHRLQEYLESNETWATTHCGILKTRPVAYFSAEFGLHESLPIYSGGLGLLAGDHIKSASDLGVPLIGVGLFYTQGYFRQRLDESGWQQEDYLDVNTSLLPAVPAFGSDGQPLTVSVETRTGVIHAKVWRLTIGRTTLYLLDSDVPGNAKEDRELTARLYYGDSRVRIRQELMLGVGGLRALKALGIEPGVLHLNEGHSAFAPLEMIRWLMSEDGLDFDEAARVVARQTVFTTHTPVPAGHDRFSPDLLEEHLGPLRDAIGISRDHLLSLGRENPHNHGELFCMTVIALKLSRRANGVSALHGHVSRRMWTGLWPHEEEHKIPIGHITNGVHVPTWLAPQMHRLYDRHFGVDWPEQSADPEVWKRISDVKDSELWEVHLALKSRLIEFARRRIAASKAPTPDKDGAPKTKSKKHLDNSILSPDALTIGFARRFATYKRANLILTDLVRLMDLMTDPQRPIQFIFAGKAHPHDQPGKTVLQQIAQLNKNPKLAGKIIFLEDYDINVGRHLVQGVDVWLNNPRRPLEASGTSGQKVVLNGGLNCSILDGWWAEAYDGFNGFAIDQGRIHRSPEIQDQRDAEGLYRVLVQEVIPMYYDRDERGLPRKWISYMKHAISSLGWRFNANRMVMDYVQQCYVPAAGGLSCEMKP